jgi:hypothetical protein
MLIGWATSTATLPDCQRQPKIDQFSATEFWPPSGHCSSVVAVGTRPRSVFESVAVAFEGDDFGVVDEAVDHGGGYDVVAEDLSPATEGFVAGHDQGCPFVAGGHELEEQVVVQPLDDPLGLRVAWPADQHLRSQGPAETLAVGGELAALTAPPPDRAPSRPKPAPAALPRGRDGAETASGRLSMLVGHPCRNWMC